MDFAAYRRLRLRAGDLADGGRGDRDRRRGLATEELN